MADLLDLVEMENVDPEYIPEILPVDARISIRGPVDSLVELFSRAVGVIPSSTAIPGTEFALLEAFSSTDNVVAHAKITATDGEQTISVVVEGLNIVLSGAVLVPGRRILDILKLAPSSMVRLEIVGTAASIRSGRAQWTVQVPSGDSLPPLPDVSNITLHSVPTRAILSGLQVTRKAVAPTAARPALMQASLLNGKITACDGGRVHQQFMEGVPKSLKMSIPVKVMDELIKALKATDEEHVMVGSSDFHLVFKIGNDTIIASRLLIKFPDIDQLLLGPAMSNQNTLTLNSKELAEVIKRVRVNADPDYASIYLALIPGAKDEAGHIKWSLAVRARDHAGNASQEVMDCLWVGGTKARELCVNHKNLSDFLSVYESENAIFKIGDDTKSVRSPIFLEDTAVGFSGVVQQMRIQGFVG